MPLRLKNPKSLPPDGFLFFQNGRTFNEMFSFSGKAQLIQVFRRDNGLPGATIDEVSTDLENATCNRRPELCFDPGQLSVPNTAYGRVVTGCASCGGQKA